MKGLRTFWLLAASFLGSVATATSSSAQVAISGSYYEEVNATACINTTCALYFHATPQLLLLSKVSCLVSDGQPAQLAYMSLAVADTNGGAIRRTEYLPIPSNVAAFGFNYYSVVAATDFLFGVAKFPVITVQSSAADGVTINCKITGRLQ